MKLASIFFTASKSYLRFFIKDTNKRARYAKFTLAYFKTSESIFEVHLKDTNKRVNVFTANEE